MFTQLGNFKKERIEYKNRKLIYRGKLFRAKYAHKLIKLNDVARAHDCAHTLKINLKTFPPRIYVETSCLRYSSSKISKRTTHRQNQMTSDVQKKRQRTRIFLKRFSLNSATIKISDQKGFDPMTSWEVIQRHQQVTSKRQDL